jgi:hypothetical protein
MSKQNPRTSSVRKLSSFDIRSITKKPPAPSLAYRRPAPARRLSREGENRQGQAINDDQTEDTSRDDYAEAHG